MVLITAILVVMRDVWEAEARGRSRVVRVEGRGSGMAFMCAMGSIRGEGLNHTQGFFPNTQLRKMMKGRGFGVEDIPKSRKAFTMTFGTCILNN